MSKGRAIHEDAIVILTAEYVQLEDQAKDIREGIPDWETNAELAEWLEEADWTVFDLKRSVIVLTEAAGITA